MSDVGATGGPVSDENRVHIFDTTLRDGEQSPGISLNTQEKVEIAQQLARLGVDVIEAGFPITSPGDFEAVEAIARSVEGPVICGLARTHKADIDAAWGAIKDSERPRIHTFISTSDIHIEHQLQTTREDVKGQAKAAVALAKSYCEDVEFSPMDATRADIEFTAEVCAIAVAEGADVINIPDTVGYTTPEEYAAYFERLYELVPELREVEVSVHCHDDLGLAVANSYAGRAGRRAPGRVRRQRDRRAGRQLLAGGDRDAAADPPRRARPRHRHRHARAGPHQPHGLPPDRLLGAAEQGGRRAATPSPTSPASTRTACSRSARPTRSWTRPRSAWSRTRSCSASTPAATRCRTRCEQLGFKVEGNALNQAFKRFKEIADKKKQVTALDLEAIVSDEMRERAEAYDLAWFEVEAGSRARPAGAGRRDAAQRRGVGRARHRATARSTRSSARSARRPAPRPSCGATRSRPSPGARTRSAR